jgi:ABC-type Zn uptake system ZnuABC Zn-binding protein ZnuA
MAKANRIEVEALHNLLCMYYADQLGSGEELSSGTLAAINAFLKNNDIKVDVMEQDSPQNLSNLLQNLVTEGVSQ